jgi:hypothetical protein
MRVQRECPDTFDDHNQRQRNCEKVIFNSAAFFRALQMSMGKCRKGVLGTEKEVHSSSDQVRRWQLGVGGRENWPVQHCPSACHSSIASLNLLGLSLTLTLRPRDLGEKSRGSVELSINDVSSRCF